MLLLIICPHHLKIKIHLLTVVDEETWHTTLYIATARQRGGEYTDVYEADEDYDGPPYVSKPMITGKHGASYTPPGWKSG